MRPFVCLKPPVAQLQPLYLRQCDQVAVVAGHDYAAAFGQQGWNQFDHLFARGAIQVGGRFVQQ